MLGGVFSIDVLNVKPGSIWFRVQGSQVYQTFAHEHGGHRWQRTPPTERRGRVHTSTITVAVLKEPTTQELNIPERDLEILAVKGSGAGGQHRNTTCSAVRIKHLPTGIEARCESERSQHRNKAEALSVLRARVWEHYQQQHQTTQDRERKQQVGTGQRGDKRRTIRQQDNTVHDHLTNRRWSFDAYERGQW